MYTISLYYLHETQSTLLYTYTKPIARHPSFQPCVVFMIFIHLRWFQLSRPTGSIQWAKPVRLRPCEAGPRIAAKADSMAASCSMSYSCLKVLADSKYRAVSSLWASFVQPSTQSEFKDTSATKVIQIPTKQSSIREQGLISLTYSPIQLASFLQLGGSRTSSQLPPALSWVVHMYKTCKYAKRMAKPVR